MFIDKEINDLN